VDLDAAEAAARSLLTAFGADLEAEGLRETPRRIAHAYAELLTPTPFTATTFPNDEGYDEPVVVRDRVSGWTPGVRRRANTSSVRSSGKYTAV